MVPEQGSRRVVRVRVSMAVLSDLLKCQRLGAGEKVTSNLPQDAQIVKAMEMPDDLVRGGGVLTLLVESDDFGPCSHGEVPPEFAVTFTRHKARGR